jgi:hypothetical protein
LASEWSNKVCGAVNATEKMKKQTWCVNIASLVVMIAQHLPQKPQSGGINKSAFGGI